MTFTEKIEKLLSSNHIREVIDEFLKFLNEVPHSQADAKNDAGELRGQIIVLSGRFTDLNSKINTNTVSPDGANQERASIIKSFIQILNQLPSAYPDLNAYLVEKNEEDDWRDTQARNTIDGYHVYFNKYPNGKYKSDTLKLIADLEDVKQKQDNEIKRLALLEKERRDNDKQAAEVPRQKLGSTPATNANFDGQDAPVKSKKGLFIGAGAGVLVLIIIFALLMNRKSTESDTMAVEDTASSESTVPSNAVKAELKLAYESVMEDYRAAMSSGDKSKLSESVSGEALKKLSKVIDSLTESKLVCDLTQADIEIQSIRLMDDDQSAEVKVHYTESILFRNQGTNDCAAKIPLYPVTETFYFTKTPTGWMVTAYTDGDEPVPDPVACTTS